MSLRRRAVLAAGFGLAAAARAVEPAETPWESLMPKNWDPLKKFQLGSSGAVADGSQRANDMLREMREIWDNAPTVPAMDGCIHSPPPPANQIVHVVAPQPLKGVRTMDAVWVSGTLRIARTDSAMGTSGYTIGDPTVRPYVPKAR